MVHASSEQCSERLVSDIVVVDVDVPHFARELALLQRHHSGEVQIGEIGSGHRQGFHEMGVDLCEL